MKKKKESKQIKVIIYSFLLILLFIFYLRQQVIVIKYQNQLKCLYDEIKILENKNKELYLKKQKLKDSDRLRKLAEELNFVPIKETDIIKINE
ncbi:MAG: hypothetical protein ACK4WJ_00410 [Endomicrobiia bacterium]